MSTFYTLQKRLYLKIGGVCVEMFCNSRRHLSKRCLHCKLQTKVRLVRKVLVDKRHLNLKTNHYLSYKKIIKMNNWDNFRRQNIGLTKAYSAHRGYIRGRSFFRKPFFQKFILAPPPTGGVR